MTKDEEQALTKAAKIAVARRRRVDELHTFLREYSEGMAGYGPHGTQRVVIPHSRADLDWSYSIELTTPEVKAIIIDGVRKLYDQELADLEAMPLPGAR